MPKLVQYNNRLIEFPDDMSDMEIAAKLRQMDLQPQIGPRNASPEAPGATISGQPISGYPRLQMPSQTSPRAELIAKKLNGERGFAMMEMAELLAISGIAAAGAYAMKDYQNGNGQ